MMNWERYGLRIGVSEGSLSFEETAEAAVVALVGGNFVFPDNTVVVSAVYAVSLSRPLFKPLRLEIQHCVDLSRGVNPKYLKFAIAPVDTPSLPYQFSIVEGGEFSAGEWYGSINREKFCLVSIVGISTNGVEGEGQQQQGEEGGDQQNGGEQNGEEGEQHNGGGEEGGQHDNGGGGQQQEQSEGEGQQQEEERVDEHGEEDKKQSKDEEGQQKQEQQKQEEEEEQHEAKQQQTEEREDAKES